MLVKAGVTSALDMSGPGTSVLELAREYGTGLNLATIEYVRPGHTVSSDDPSSAELQQLITKVQRQGSLGIKLLGGHYPLTVAATARAIKMCIRDRCPFSPPIPSSSASAAKRFSSVSVGSPKLTAVR